MPLLSLSFIDSVGLAVCFVCLRRIISASFCLTVFRGAYATITLCLVLPTPWGHAARAALLPLILEPQPQISRSPPRITTQLRELPSQASRAVGLVLLLVRFYCGEPIAARAGSLTSGLPGPPSRTPLPPWNRRLPTPLASLAPLACKRCVCPAPNLRSLSPASFRAMISCVFGGSPPVLFFSCVSHSEQRR